MVVELVAEGAKLAIGLAVEVVVGLVAEEAAEVFEQVATEVSEQVVEEAAEVVPMVEVPANFYLDPTRLEVR